MNKSVQERLQSPFPYEEIEWRIQSCGKGQKGIWAKAVPYVDNRAIMRRLDEVLGLENWTVDFQEWKGKGTVCCLSIRTGDGAWITKCDGADDPETESIKGGFSAAQKRAAVQLGIGRYLYGIPIDFLPEQCISSSRKDGWHWARLGQKDGGESFYWKPPLLPSWALPEKNIPEWDGKDWRTCPVHTPPQADGKLLGDVARAGQDWLLNQWTPGKSKEDLQLVRALQRLSNELAAQTHVEQTNEEPAEVPPY